MPKNPLILALATLPAFAFPALAQVAQDNEALPLVSVAGRAVKVKQLAPNLATGIAASALETPFSTSTVPADLVREQAGTTLQEALHNVPGAQADSGFNGSHTQFFILRGAVADSGTGSNRVLRDGVRLSNYPYVPAFLDSVDVLRGPGAAVGVRSEPGGTVNLSTHQPHMRDFGSAYQGAGSAGANEVSVDLNRVLSQDGELAARLMLTHSKGNKWRHVPDLLDGIKLGLAKSDGDRYHLRLGIEATNQTYRPDYGVPALNGRPVAVPRDRQLGEPFGDSTTNNRIADLHGDVAIDPDTRFALDASHLSADSTSIKNVLTGSELAGQPAGSYARVSSWEPGTTRRIDSWASSFTRLQYIGDIRHQLYLGLDYYREVLDQPSLAVPASTSPSINVFSPVYDHVTAPAAGAALARSLTTEDLDALGASAQDKVDFGAWSVVAGVRFDRQKFLFGSVGVLPVKESRWSPKLAVLHRASANDTFYANVSTGTSPNQVSSSSKQSLPSRQSAQAELGWKSLWRDGTLTSEVAVYRLNQSHMISADTSTALNNFDFTTVGSARSRGLEASLTGALTERLSVAASYAYTDARYNNNADYAGKQVPNVARQVLSLWGQCRWDAAWKTGAGVYGQSRRFADEANTAVLPGYARFDVIQTWTHKLDGGQALELQLALRNLFDVNYFVSSHLHVSRWITPGQGRNVALSGTYRF